MAFIDFFDRGWRANPKGIAYIMGDQSWTFTEARELSCRVANGLVGAGFAKEAKAAVLAMNDPAAWICALGLWRAGLAWIPLSPRGSAAENRQILDGFDCEVIFFQQAFAPMVAEMRPQLPRIRQWICIDGELADAPSLQAWCGAQPTTTPDVDYQPDDIITVMPTARYIPKRSFTFMAS